MIDSNRTYFWEGCWGSGLNINLYTVLRCVMGVKYAVSMVYSRGLRFIAHSWRPVNCLPLESILFIRRVLGISLFYTSNLNRDQ